MPVLYGWIKTIVIDRFKIANGLRACECKGSCDTCPYVHYAGDSCVDVLMQEAFDLINEPVDVMVCGEITHYFACCSCMGAVDYGDIFCRHCGRKLIFHEGKKTDT